MKKIPLSIRLEFKKSILYEIQSGEIAENITIGRARDCTWIIPMEDSLASGHHAVITMKKSQFYVCDTGSRNGIFLNGQRISEKKLQTGDAIAIGDCLLIVEKAVIKKTGGINQIQILSGPDSGKIVELMKDHFIIGSAPGCDILLMNQLVSRKHAEIAVRPDGCWLSDAGGKNGTLVNGNRLKTGTERLLKDSDIISIAQFDLKYLDGTVVHTQSRLWHSLLIMAVTAIVVLAGYYAYIRANPSAFEKLKDARAAAALGDFGKAETLLAESRNCRGAEDCRLRGDELKRDIENWRETIRQWGVIRKHLADARWTDAAQALGSVDPSQLNLWSWNDTDAAEYRKQAFTAKRLLDAYITAKNSAQIDETPLDIIRKRAEAVKYALASAGKQKVDYLEKLQKQARDLMLELNTIISSNDKVDLIVADLKGQNVPYDQIINDLEAMLKSSKGSLRLKIEKLLLPIKALKKSNTQLLRSIVNITEMNFDQNISEVLELPPLEQCLVNPHIASLRRRQNDISESLRDTARQLKFLCQALADNGITLKQTVPEHLSCFQNDQVMAQVFRCDVLDGKMPSRMRKSPAGQYDRVLGMEPFYSYLYSLPMDFDPASYDEISFPVQIFLAWKTYRKLEDFQQFFLQEKNLIFCRGKLAGYKSFTDSLLAERTQLIRKLTARPMTTREGLIANGIAMLLAGKKDLPADAAEAYKKALQNYRKPLIKLNSEFSTALPERAVQIRDEIIRRGLPGDPLVRSMWSKR